MPEFADETHFYSLKRDDPHYTAVGRVASAWAFFEFHIEQAIWELADIEQSRGACITGQIFTVSNLFKAYIAVANLEGAILTSITKLNQMLSNQVNPLAEERNRIVHDPWVYGKLTGAIAQIRATADRKLDYRFRERTIEEIDETWRKIIRLDSDFRLLAAELASPILQERQIRNALPDTTPPTRSQ